MKHHGECDIYNYGCHFHGKLYHYTTITCLFRILDSQEIKPSSLNGSSNYEGKGVYLSSYSPFEHKPQCIYAKCFYGCEQFEPSHLLSIQCCLEMVVCSDHVYRTHQIWRNEEGKPEIVDNGIHKFLDQDFKVEIQKITQIIVFLNGLEHEVIQKLLQITDIDIIFLNCNKIPKYLIPDHNEFQNHYCTFRSGKIETKMDSNNEVYQITSNVHEEITGIETNSKICTVPKSSLPKTQ